MKITGDKLRGGRRRLDSIWSIGRLMIMLAIAAKKQRTQSILMN
ncbi:MAG: hypothetical protein WBB82_13130 [Limnothrix sp.]